MSDQTLTREFSICLLPTDDVAQDIQTLRRDLPESPYRDDPPHITLLRGIAAKTELSDEALVQAIEDMLSLTDNLPLMGQVTAITNRSNQFYSASGLLLLEPSPQLSQFRRHVMNQLEESSYEIEDQELAAFMPHVTIRLGVALEDKKIQHAEELFINRTLTFNSWLLFRLVKENDKRSMRQVSPSSV